MSSERKIAATVDFKIANNAYWDDSLQFGIVGDTSWNFTGVGFLMDVKAAVTDTAPLLSLSSGAGTLVVDDVTQRILHLFVPDHSIRATLQAKEFAGVYVPPAGTTTPEEIGEYFYDLVMVTNATGQRDVLCSGKVIVVTGVTVED